MIKNKIIISITVLLGISSIYSQWEPDKWLKDPVNDQVFSSYVDFMKYDQSLDFDLKTIDIKEEDGIKTEHISFLSTSNERVTAYFITSMIGKINNYPTMIMLHGGGKRGKDGIVKISKLHARDGINILSIDMQYFGERKTELINDFTEKEKHDKLYNQESQYLSFVIQTVKDVGRSFDLLVKNYSIPKEKIGLMGFSRGAVLASIVGGYDIMLKSVALIIGGHFDRFEDGHLAAACPANYVGRINPRPLLFLNGLYDSDFDADRSVKPLHALTKDSKIIWLEMGHGYPGDENMLIVGEWIKKSLNKGK